MAPLAPIVWPTPGKREHSATLSPNQNLFAYVMQLYSLDGEQRQLRRAGGDSRLDLVSPVLPLLDALPWQETTVNGKALLNLLASLLRPIPYEPSRK